MINLRSRAWHNVVFRIGMPVVLWAAGWPLLAAAAQVPDPLQGAQWIQAPHASAQDAVMPVFRRQFVLEKPLQRATLTIAALGQGEVHVNGVKAGDAELTPSWTDYRKTIRYQQLDVTPLLHPGQNVMGVLVGNGMYNVVRTPHRYTKLENSYGAPRLIALLQLRYTDGTTGRIASDAAWQTTAGPIVFSSTYGGEDYDATREPAGWDKPAAVAPGWQPAQLTDGPGGALHAEVEPPIRVMQRYAAKRLADPRPGVAVYDFGQNFAGWPE
ncbi:MAG: alpha-L-rhamnosidase N-terminal domain-containing protein, partial [Acidobacteriota bacterium]|nr:alpha-L-rhamnosidase N-terminal domain-containing protein [Acidobacteriota bacterium]